MSDKIKIAIDAMGGENSPKKIIDGIEKSLSDNTENFFYIFGREDLLKKEIDKRKMLHKKSEIVDSADIIADDESPFTAAKKGKESSMWKSIELQKKNLCDITLSAGNTGALLIMSKLLLKTLHGINKPALAGLWPSKKNMSIVLDLGANVECNEKNLVDFACMGSALHKSIFKIDKPKIALLNIGLEEIKGNEILKNAYTILKNSEIKNFDFSGYIEGNQIMDGDVDVIITDGFTGNVALKTAEGTANFITQSLKKSLNKISILFSYPSLKKFKSKLDPRKYNGAIFLGLQGPVVKSHGSTDSIGFANSINLCTKIIKGNVIEKIQNNLITVDAPKKQ